MERGTRSEGFRMRVFPHAMAYGRNQYESIAGKLKGTMAATTPSGWGDFISSTPRATPPRVLVPVPYLGAPDYALTSAAPSLHQAQPPESVSPSTASLSLRPPSLT